MKDFWRFLFIIFLYSLECKGYDVNNQLTWQDTTNEDILVKRLNSTLLKCSNGFYFTNGNYGSDVYKLNRLSRDYILFEVPSGSYFDSIRYVPIDSTFKVQSDLSFIFGSKKEQSFTIHHEQALSVNTKFYLGFDTYKSPGFYLRQLNKGKNFILNFEKANIWDKVNFQFSYDFKQMQNQLNGGIVDVKDFIDSKQSNFKLFDVRLKDSESFFRNHLVSTNILYDLKELKDSSQESFFSELEFNSTFRSFGRVFTSGINDLQMFNHVYIDSSFTFDSLRIYENKNILSIVARKSKIQFTMGVSNHLLRYNIEDVNISNNILSAFILSRYDLIKDIDIEISAKKSFLSKKYSRNYSISLLSNFYVKAAQTLSASIGVIQNVASAFEEKYYSNHFIWNNDFNPTMQKTFSLTYNNRLKGLDAIIRYTNLKDAIYFGANAEPVQASGGIDYLQSFFKISQTYGRYVVNSEVNFNNSSTRIVPLPDFFVSTELGYRFELFKRNLSMVSGFEVDYFTSVFAPAYEPATGVYYLQNETKTGNYPLFNLFFNFEIKKAVLSIRIDHLNDRWSKRNYFMIPNYPLNGRALYFGVNWKFDS